MNLTTFEKEIRRGIYVLGSEKGYLQNRIDISEWYAMNLITFEQMAYLNQMNFYLAKGENDES